MRWHTRDPAAGTNVIARAPTGADCWVLLFARDAAAFLKAARAHTECELWQSGLVRPGNIGRSEFDRMAFSCIDLSLPMMWWMAYDCSLGRCVPAKKKDAAPQLIDQFVEHRHRIRIREVELPTRRFESIRETSMCFGGASQGSEATPKCSLSALK